ncbi:MAG: hypothetical protein GWN55_06520 [Phycisphaerae bacterium]|nr:hypothetical protein [Phycisphaerae bacterium]NIR49421.1 hypothetical protein [candidate division KSB1 bacterium]NIR72356.1 hypothetical protein [candidate division KSB1 bacterium]NIU25516.1 hypothetical protein [candidate division KSB1 bacterium]NIV00967.1 hypothetical protein [Phycisphaerae bacterium]
MSVATWVKELLKGLDSQVDENAKKTIMAACGEKCPFTHLTDSRLMEIRNKSESEREFLANLCNEWRLRNEKGQHFVVFDQCYCPLVNEDLKGASKTLCYCTEGNLKHKFRLALGREVEVETQKTILRGHDECRFLIKVGNV